MAAVVCLVLLVLVCGGVLAFLLWRYRTKQKHCVRHKSYFRLCSEDKANAVTERETIITWGE